jgi:hypothetical protein
VNVVSINSPRGTVIKVPDATPGILSVNNKQYLFTLEGIWKSPVAPSPNQSVAIELDSSGALTSVTVVDAQQLAKERLGELSNVAQEHGKALAEQFGPILSSLTARMGAVALAAAVLIWIASYFFPAAGIAGVGGGGDGIGTFTFRTLLGTDLNDQSSLMNPGHARGLLRFVTFIAIVVPFAVPVIRASWSRYLNAAPLAAVLVGWLVVHENIAKTFAAMPGADNPFGFKWGFYVLLLASLVLAAGALKKPAGPHV